MLGRSLDELPPQTRRLLKLVDQYVIGECERLKIRRSELRFSRRALREGIDWGDTQLKVHLSRLVELEYLVGLRTRTGGLEYELVYDVGGGENTLRFPGLADVEALRCAYDGARSGQSDVRSGSGRGAVGPRSVGGRAGEAAAEPASKRVGADLRSDGSEMHCSAELPKILSYTQKQAVGAASSLAAGV